MFARLATKPIRNAMTTIVRQSHGHGGVPGEVIIFSTLHNLEPVLKEFHITNSLFLEFTFRTPQQISSHSFVRCILR